jgi:hypothetical protein
VPARISPAFCVQQMGGWNRRLPGEKRADARQRDISEEGGRGPPEGETAAFAYTTRETPYIEGAAGAAAFFAVRRLAGLRAALRAGFFVAFFATLRFAVFFAPVLRPAFFAVLRAGFLAAALRTVVFFAGFFLRAGFLFAVIGIWNDSL